jgi:hypothetical protein
MSSLLNEKLDVLNVGLDSFAETINQSGGIAHKIDWQPPAIGDRTIGLNLAKTINNEKIDAANKIAFDRYLSSQPIATGIATAIEAMNGLGERQLLHSGPPIDFERMADPVKGAVMGAILYEGWADTAEQALELAATNEISYAPCHHFNAVGPMAGLISPSMPVWVIEDEVHGGETYSNFNEGLGKVLRYGAYSDEVLNRLHWIADTLAPVLTRTLEKTGSIELKPLMAQALHMGDEVHNRNVAASSLLLKKLAPSMSRSGAASEDIATTLEYMANNDLFFLNLGMPACKAMLNAAHGVEGSTMTTVMARNGVEFGIRVSGLGDQWFTAPVTPAKGLFFSGYTQEDAAPDLGDSAITETAGLGGFAMAAAPAIVQFIGGTSDMARQATEEMIPISIGRNPAFTLPTLNFAGSPAGIDIRKVVDSSTAPFINTGIAHKKAGVGQIGAGITRAPMECFIKAMDAYCERYV